MIRWLGALDKTKATVSSSGYATAPRSQPHKMNTSLPMHPESNVKKDAMANGPRLI